MKKTILIMALGILCFIGGYSQDGGGNQRELGARFSSLNDFDFIYKKQRSENKYLRLGLARITNSSAFVDGSTLTTTNLGVSIGLEKRIPIAKKLKFFRGPVASLSGSAQFLSGRDIYNVNIGLNYVLGIMYEINDIFYVGADTAPGFNVTYGDNGATESWTTFLGFNSQALSFTLAVRFPAKKKK